MCEEIKETLKKQLQLLSERSQKECTAFELCELSNSMLAIGKFLIDEAY